MADEIKEVFSTVTLKPINEPLPDIETIDTTESLTEEQVEAVIKLPKDAFTNIS